MNSKECLDWLGGVADSFPELRLKDLRSAVETLAAAQPAGRWEGGLCGPAGFSRLAIRFHGPASNAAKIFGVRGLSAPKAAAPGFARLRVVWDCKAGRWESLRLLGAAGRGGAAGSDCRRAKNGRPAISEISLAARAFRPAGLGEPALEKALSAFAELCPVEDEVRGPGGQWALRLAGGAPFPAFLRCDISAAFTPLSSQLAFLLLDRRVVELAFDGDALWAYFRG
ncbi:MAG: hypothetical protein HY077_16825 [Elusimicrobia bacterium]|nr:hypothetical protein [Elusimicrobiota bacterium]